MSGQYTMGKPTMAFLRSYLNSLPSSADFIVDDGEYLRFNTPFETPMLTLHKFGYTLSYHEVSDGYNKFHHYQVRVKKPVEQEK